MKTQEGFARIKPGGSIRRENNWFHIGVDKHETIKGAPANDTMVCALIIYGADSIAEFKRMREDAEKWYWYDGQRSWTVDGFSYYYGLKEPTE